MTTLEVLVLAYLGTGVLVGIETGLAGKHNLWTACGGRRPDLVATCAYWGYLIVRSAVRWPFDMT